MKTVYKLFRLQIDDKYDIFKGKSFRKIVASIAKSIGIIVAISFGLYMVLSQLLILGFSVNIQLISIVILIMQGVLFFFALGNIISTLFINRDNELLMALPASPNQIFFSKMMVIYVSEIIVNAVITLPFLTVFGIVGGYGIWYFLSFIPIALVLPLLPLCLASFFSIPMMFILKFFKKHIVLTVITVLAFISVAILIYTNLLSSLAASFNLTTKQLETVSNANKAIVAFGNSNVFFLGLVKFMTHIKYIPWLLLYLGVGGGLMALGILLIRPFFFVMAMSSFENDTTIKKIGKFRKRTQMNSLIGKEILTVFRSPGYVFQYFLFVLLMPLIVVLYDNLLIAFVVNQTGSFMIAGAHVLIMCVLANLSCLISASAISREGGNFYIVKTTPVNYYKQSLAKLMFNGVFIVGAIFITAISSLFYLPFYVVICSSFAALFMSLGHMFYSFDLDLKRPTLDWFDSGEISKVSKNTAKSIGWGLVLGLIAGLMIMAMSMMQQVVISWVLLIVLSLTYCAYKAYVLALRVFYQYDKLEM